MSEKMVYFIRDWHTRYEVNAKGGGADDGDKLRLKPLEFVRWQVRGRDIGIGLRRVNKIAGEEFAPSVFGVFAKLVEIAAQEKRGRRGYVLTSDGEPMTVADISEACGWSEVVISKALAVLTHDRVQWVQLVDFPEFREFPEIPAPYITEENRREQKRTEHKPKIARARGGDSVSADTSPSQAEAPTTRRRRTTPATPVPPTPTTPQSTTEHVEKSPETGQGSTNGGAVGSSHHRCDKIAPRASSRENGTTTTRKPTDDEMRQQWQRAAAAHEAGLPIPPKPGGTAPATNGTHAALNRILGSIGTAPDPQASHETLLKRIKAVTGDSQPYMDWWRKALPAITAAPGTAGAFLSALDYAADCAHEATRAAKGLGPLKNPGGYVLSKTLIAARAEKVAVPALPADATQAQPVSQAQPTGTQINA